ncbi:MAG: DNA methyltransferase [Byssovorax sp.]
MDIPAFISKWHLASGGERKTKDYFLLDLCSALGVPQPDVGQDRYGFEADVLHVHEGGKTTTLRVDLYKHGCFILEAKQGSNPGDPKVGHGKRGSEAWNKAMQSAYGQAVGYARSMDDPPPFLVVCDIGYVIELYADFDHSGYYRPFPNAQKHRRYLADLEVHAADLRALFLDPMSLDPARAGIKVTREIAEDLAQIAKLLEGKGHAPTLVAKFLMRCLFTMFAEDVELLPDDMFTKLLDKNWTKKPETFVGGVEQLWRVMNSGGYYGPELVRHFNGGLFEDPIALPLDDEGLKLLLGAARRDWSGVEPSIFGTLLERALDPTERHKLGAHYTPRAYVERLVRPTIEEPVRTEWENAQALSLKLRADGKVDGAKAVVHAFHQKLCATRVLDPACGSGNFLYVTLNILKQIESEVLALLVELGEKQEQLIRITPGNFRGIEVKPWGKEIAELVLWIGYLQWHYRTHGKGMPPPSPVLQDFGNIECRDAVLAWDRTELVLDEKGKPITRWDGATYKKSPVTGEVVPDDTARTVSYRYINPRMATWPSVEYIVGNPPFGGGWKIRQFQGDGYVDALWATYPDMPEKSDYVMYWWERAAEEVRANRASRFGFITTNSITQVFQRRVLQRHLDRKDRPLKVVFAIPDHPWVDSEQAAAVRVAMTVGSHEAPPLVQLGEVIEEHGEDSVIIQFREVGRINPDLTSGTNLDLAAPLVANNSLCSAGVQLYGAGFILDQAEATRLDGLVHTVAAKHIIRPYLNGRDFSARSRGAFVIDFFGYDESEAAHAHPFAFQYVLDRVKPERDQNRRESIKSKWWRFGWERPVWRASSAGLKRFISTPETAKHRVMIFLDAAVLPDNMLTNFALEDAFFLGVLSSRLHVTWALRAGGRLGVGNDPRYTKTRCFDPFPFPICTPAKEQKIRTLGEQLDAHRKSRQAAHPDLTITGMYNVLEKLRANAELTDKDRVIHEHGLVSLLKKIHDDLDAAVFEAYGWPVDLTDEQILEKLVALNAERAAEEKKGLIRWLRPDFQNPSGKKPETQAALLATGEDDEDPQSAPPPAAIKPWPKKIAEQIAAVRDRVAFPGKLFTVESVAAAFKGAKKKDIEGFLEGFAALGVLTMIEDPTGKRWRAAGKST